MSPTILRDQPAVELADVVAGRLPARYEHPMQDVFLARLDGLLTDGVRILDVGAGRSPTIAPADRPAGTRYVALDVSAEELSAAPPGAFDRTVVADVTRPPDLGETFDLVLSWQVLEHVASVGGALRCMHALTSPGGTLLAQLSGSRAVFAIVSRALPHRMRVRAMRRLLGSPAEEKFPTHYDGCHVAALERHLRRWESFEIVPFYRGAGYFAFSRPLQRLYLAYEDVIARRDRRELATHYLLVARR
jgi:hypothetical protein